MTARNLDTRIGRLEAKAPADRGQHIDPATLTDEQLEVCERIPLLPNGNPDFDAMTDHDLRILASIDDGTR